MVSGTTPVNLLFEKSKTSTIFRPSKPVGNHPEKLLLLRSMTDAFASSPISVGTQPPMLLFEKMISFRFGMRPMLFGMQPLNLLLANTATETVDLPRVSGMVEVNRLSLRNNASNSSSKSSGGKGPSKSLYLRSRYTRPVIANTTFGNGPTKRLLLTSNSFRSWSLLKPSGMTPQNLFELMWNKAISVKSSSSGGRCPAMSPWLISIPATTFNEGSSSA